MAVLPRIPGGFSRYAKDGKLTYCRNFCGIEHHFVQGSQAIPDGKHQVRMNFAYDGGGIRQGRQPVGLLRRRDC